MITQAIKCWLHKLFGWLSRKPVAEAEHARAEAPLNTGMASEQVTRPSIDGVTPPFGAVPLILGQGETSCSTLDERPDSTLQPPSTPPSLPSEKIELPNTPPPIPTTTPPPIPTTAPPVETSIAESLPAQTPSTQRNVPPATPTAEQKLEFLLYLVKRGIVNEGFAEGQIPQQYRHRG